MDNLKNKSVIELKAVAYDLLAKQQQLSQILTNVNNAMAMKEREETTARNKLAEKSKNTTAKVNNDAKE